MSRSFLEVRLQIKHGVEKVVNITRVFSWKLGEFRAQFSQDRQMFWPRPGVYITAFLKRQMNNNTHLTIRRQSIKCKRFFQLPEIVKMGGCQVNKHCIYFSDILSCYGKLVGRITATVAIYARHQSILNLFTIFVLYM